ncbi:uncharacterized protein LOC121371854 [Gigantopelta aegis]|uniref:uncharacterized protein LOC121371854 n=1 Tax=Gigantopelta aegis TaxID=1735272 RepID=UPI001B88A7E4|nr:uncharacterized protein LOC121371854 [Gigantopelta aegis]XP_041353995.1 uncharacterized protein LOC121371854 [Gigantopelta aegis]
MTNQPTKVHDPLFHFETHFPDRLSRLHLHQEFSHSVRRNKKVKRSGARYKTQPVTFDEIQEVDEEPSVEDKREDGLKGKLQAFSRSMDGLLPKVPQLHPRHSYSPTLQKKFDHPPIILEKCEQEGRLRDDPKSPSPSPDKRLSSRDTNVPPAEARLQDKKDFSVPDQTNETWKKQDSLLPSPTLVAETPKPNLPSPNMAPRRQKITAKAKKRQKATEDCKET